MNHSDDDTPPSEHTDIGVDEPETVLGELDETVEADPNDEHIELAEQLAREQYETARDTLRSSWEKLNLAKAQQALADAYGWRIALERIKEPATETRTVHIDSLVLADCYQSLFADPEVETIVYLTGLDLDEANSTVNRRIEMDHEVQKSVKAAGNSDSSFDTLLALEQSGHRLLAHCHNHPGTHDAAPEPSEVDRTYQGQLEGGGYEPVGLIMSIDGHVRIFTNDLDVEITIHGNHVKRLDDKRLFLEEPARNASERLEDA